jgi:hypothetical protein
MGRWEDYQLRGKRRRQLLREERETRIGWRRALALWARPVATVLRGLARSARPLSGLPSTPVAQTHRTGAMPSFREDLLSAAR